MKSKKILITGGTGFVGANLVHRLINEGYKPTVLIRKDSNVWRLKNIISKIELLETDIFNYERLKKDIGIVRPQYIYHLAVYGAYQTIQKDIKKTLETNIFGTINLLNAGYNSGLEYFVNTGSSSEYGIKEKIMKETDILCPVNYYGVTKAATTLITSTFSIQNKLPAVTFRLFSPYGYYEDKDRFVPTVIMAGIKNEAIELSNPSFVRDFIFIDDVIDAYIYFLNSKKYYGEIFNIGSGKQTKLGDFVKTIEKVLGNKIKIKWTSYESNQFEPKKWQADISKAKSTLNWSPKNSMISGIQKISRWYKENYNLYL
ncbi:MAG: GDP-mannose 4,6-dehydratase [bacterium]|nr:GDP-mannose 4,6-dehydratase [bacterium]